MVCYRERMKALRRRQKLIQDYEKFEASKAPMSSGTVKTVKADSKVLAIPKIVSNKAPEPSRPINGSFKLGGF